MVQGTQLWSKVCVRVNSWVQVAGVRSRHKLDRMGVPKACLCSGPDALWQTVQDWQPYGTRPQATCACPSQSSRRGTETPACTNKSHAY